MMTFGTLLDLGILWFLIVLFTDSIDSERSYRETWIVIFGMLLVGLLCRFLLGSSLQWLGTPIQLVALYYLVDWACDTERRITLKICGWYLVVSVVKSVAIYYLTRPL